MAISNGLHKKFHNSVSQYGARRFQAADPHDLRQRKAINYAEFSTKSREELIDIAATATARNTMLKRGAPYPEPEDRTVHVSTQDKDLAARRGRETQWRTEPGVYKRRAGQRKRPPATFIREEIQGPAPSHAKWITANMDDPKSEFNRGLDLTKKKTGKYTSGQRERLAAYIDALEQGASHTDALGRATRMAEKKDVGRKKTARAQRSLGQRALAPARPSGRAVSPTTRYQSFAPPARSFNLGVSAQAPPSIEDLKKKFPSLSEVNLIQMRQAATEHIGGEILANQKWAHESRRANLLGSKTGRGLKEDPNKVTIFTTNVGTPAVSVPSDSLVGQYIIRKRKAVLGGYGVPSSQLKGKFPEAIRDQHIVDVATGTAWGAQGRQGLFSMTGYRFGKKQSPGYGKPKPLGAYVLYDSSTGRPLYDEQGNIRYSEGATRDVDYISPMLGARILIG